MTGNSRNRLDRDTSTRTGQGSRARSSSDVVESPSDNSDTNPSTYQRSRSTRQRRVRHTSPVRNTAHQRHHSSRANTTERDDVPVRNLQPTVESEPESSEDLETSRQTVNLPDRSARRPDIANPFEAREPATMTGRRRRGRKISLEYLEDAATETGSVRTQSPPSQPGRARGKTSATASKSNTPNPPPQHQKKAPASTANKAPSSASGPTQSNHARSYLAAASFPPPPESKTPLTAGAMGAPKGMSMPTGFKPLHSKSQPKATPAVPALPEKKYQCRAKTPKDPPHADPEGFFPENMVSLQPVKETGKPTRFPPKYGQHRPFRFPCKDGHVVCGSCGGNHPAAICWLSEYYLQGFVARASEERGAYCTACEKRGHFVDTCGRGEWLVPLWLLEALPEYKDILEVVSWKSCNKQMWPVTFLKPELLDVNHRFWSMLPEAVVNEILDQHNHLVSDVRLQLPERLKDVGLRCGLYEPTDTPANITRDFNYSVEQTDKLIQHESNQQRRNVQKPGKSRQPGPSAKPTEWGGLKAVPGLPSPAYRQKGPGWFPTVFLNKILSKMITDDQLEIQKLKQQFDKEHTSWRANQVSKGLVDLCWKTYDSAWGIFKAYISQYSQLNNFDEFEMTKAFENDRIAANGGTFQPPTESTSHDDAKSSPWTLAQKGGNSKNGKSKGEGSANLDRASGALQASKVDRAALAATVSGSHPSGKAPKSDADAIILFDFLVQHLQRQLNTSPLGKYREWVHSKLLVVAAAVGWLDYKRKDTHERRIKEVVDDFLRAEKNFSSSAIAFAKTCRTGKKKSDIAPTRKTLKDLFAELEAARAAALNKLFAEGIDTGSLILNSIKAHGDGASGPFKAVWELLKDKLLLGEAPMDACFPLVGFPAEFQQLLD